MTTSPHNTLPRQKRITGFTLVEMMIAASIGSIILIGVLATFLMLVRSGVRLGNYSTMESETRRAFEQLAIDARMSNRFSSDPSGGVITSITLTIPSNDLSTVRQVTYGYDTSDSTNRKLFFVPGNDPAATTGRLILVNKVTGLTFLRYDRSNVLIPASTASNTGIKHLQISIGVSRSAVGVAATTHVIRSSAFTLSNISI